MLWTPVLWSTHTNSPFCHLAGSKLKIWTLLHAAAATPFHISACLQAYWTAHPQRGGARQICQHNTTRKAALSSHTATKPVIQKRRCIQTQSCSPEEECVCRLPKPHFLHSMTPTRPQHATRSIKTLQHNLYAPSPTHTTHCLCAKALLARPID
jgi:hypothetical protein